MAQTVHFVKIYIQEGINFVTEENVWVALFLENNNKVIVSRNPPHGRQIAPITIQLPGYRIGEIDEWNIVYASLVTIFKVMQLPTEIAKTFVNGSIRLFRNGVLGFSRKRSNWVIEKILLPESVFQEILINRPHLTELPKEKLLDVIRGPRNFEVPFIDKTLQDLEKKFQEECLIADKRHRNIIKEYLNL